MSETNDSLRGTNKKDENLIYSLQSFFLSFKSILVQRTGRETP